MKWKITSEATCGVCLTNDHVRETSYEILKSTNRRDTVLKVAPNREMAEKAFTNLMNELRSEMTGKKEPVKMNLILRKVVRNGTQTERVSNGVRVRWDNEEIKSEKIVEIGKYSGSYAKRIAKRKM